MDDSSGERKYISLDQETGGEITTNLHDLLLDFFENYVMNYRVEFRILNQKKFLENNPEYLRAIKDKDLRFFLSEFFSILNRQLDNARLSGGHSYKKEFREVDEKLAALQKKNEVQAQQIEMLTQQILMLTEASKANKPSRGKLNKLQKFGSKQS